MRKSLAAATAAVLAMATMLTGCGGGTASRAKMQEAEPGSSAASDVVINEVVSSNKYSYTLSDGTTPDWVELYNPTDSDINLKDCGFSKKASSPFEYKFGDCTVPAGGYLVLACCNKPKEPLDGVVYTGFKLGKSGETLTLSLPSGNAIAMLSIPELTADISYGRQSAENYVYYATPTPGAENSGPTSEDGTFEEDQTGKGLIMNEYIANNDYSITDADKERSAWVELKNTSGETINVKNYSLTDDENEPDKWTFPDLEIAPGELRVVFLSGKDKVAANGEIHANFKIKKGENLMLMNTARTVLDAVKVEEGTIGKSVGRSAQSSDTWSFLFVPTPGGENTSLAAEAADDTDYMPSLRINEVKTSSGGKADDADVFDWIELYNDGEDTVDLTGYGLSDSKDELYKFKFDGTTLGPGEYVIIECRNSEAKYSADFALAASGDDVYLTDTKGSIIDHMNTGVQTGGMSAGRAEGQGFEKVLFKTPSKGQRNGNDFYTGYASEPEFSAQGGYTEQGTQVSIINGDGADIYYTTDGSVPTESSQKYSSPVTISETTTLRARSFSNGKLASTTATENYIVDSNRHTIPVVCISMNPDDLLGETNGIYAKGAGYDWDDGDGSDYTHSKANYWQDWEREMNFEFFEADGTKGVDFDAGIKIFGQFSREQGQKSFSVHLRGKYGQSSVTYPFFRDYDVTTFSSLVLRSSGQDWQRTKILDAFVGQIEKGVTDLDYMEYRPVALYINGSYWGLYNLREKQNEDYVVNHYGDEGAEKGNVTILKADTRPQVGSRDEWKAMLEYLKATDMSTADAQAYVEERVNVKNYMEWVILEAFSANTDTGNKRKFKYEGGKWKWMLFDTDWAFQKDGYANNNYLGAFADPNGHGAGKAFSTRMMQAVMNNPNWRKQFVELCAERINTTFTDERMDAIVDAMAAEIADEIDRNNTERDQNTYDKWKSLTKEEWEQNIDDLKETVHARRRQLIKELQSTFGLSDERMRELITDYEE